MLKNNKLLLALFLLTVAAGIWYPVLKIIRFEFPLSPPAVFRFSATLYDPYDPFRGRYVALQGKSQTLVSDEPIDYYAGSYAVLENDEKGLAKVVGLTRKPEPGKPAIRTSYVSRYSGAPGKDAEPKKTHNYVVSFPFNRFYMNEKLAPEAERAFRYAARSGMECVIVVKVYADGNYAITDLEIDGMPIREFLKKTLAER